MDKQTRNLIQKATQDARHLLESEFSEQLEGTFDILPNGHIAPFPGKHLTDEQKITREKIVAAIAHEKAAGVSDAEAVANYLREASFTALNRFAALKMLEARGLVQECVSKGDLSAGFKEFCGLAPGLAVLPDKGYRLYIESLFDELGTEIRVLFDRRDMASLVWPRRKALEGLFEILNRPEISGVWGEDETVGWVYQYFNSSEERKKMRDESAAPRNSRELAVRNQFFTPRYVVAFLTDNTLGRIWYEMRQGETRLKESCRYLVRRPVEVFLKPGEAAPEIEPPEDLSQEELLKQPVYIPFRQIKDPRDIKMLDPACGSMHFGLYAFDLYEVIYEEAWELERALGKDAFERSSEFKPLTEAYTDKDTLLKDVPRLILEHNIHGIDIDPRATQIAALALWLRAQRSWQNIDVKAADRPRIAKSNVVTAEPMPGEENMRREFVATLDRPVVREIVTRVFKKMELAGEAGSLLKIEEAIQDDISEAKAQWSKTHLFYKRASYSKPVSPDQTSLFPEYEKKRSKQQDLRFDTRDISDSDNEFWEDIEVLILNALKKYAEQAENGNTVQRRLFAEDTAHGFAFIDLYRKRYDVVLMNPPFGEWSAQYKEQSKKEYPLSYNDILGAFIDRSGQILEPGGRIGAITSRTCFFLQSFTRWREEVVLRKLKPQLFVDLGYGVMDAAMVEAAAYVLERPDHISDVRTMLTCIRLLDAQEPASSMIEGIHALINGLLHSYVYVVDPSSFTNIPNAPFAYHVSDRIRRLFVDQPLFEGDGRTVKQGLATADDFRFVRTSWETPSESCDTNDRRWFPFAKGGSYLPFYIDIYLKVNWSRLGSEIKYLGDSTGTRPRSRPQNIDYFFKPGLTWPRRSIRLRTAPIPSGCIFSHAGMMAFAPHNTLGIVLSIMSSAPFDALCRLRTGSHRGSQFEVGVIQTNPIPEVKDKGAILKSLGFRAWYLQRKNNTADLTSNAFHICALARGSGAIQERIGNFNVEFLSNNREFAEIQREIDEVLYDLYGLIDNDRKTIEAMASVNCNKVSDLELIGEAEDGLKIFSFEPQTLVSELLDYSIGCVIGRWDIRVALGEKNVPELFDPFEPLPCCPSGQLQNEQGLPIAKEDVERLKHAAQWNYPMEISWDGIIVDDPGFNGDQPHPEDIIRRVRETLEVIWKDKASGIEHEACKILNVPDLRTYFRKSFFSDHIKRYSKSRRKAPIYWQVSTLSGSYSVWLYYHRFTKDTFYKVLNEFVLPKLQFEERELTNARQQYGPSPTAGQRKEISARESFVAELKAFKDEVARIAPLWNPNLNDGVIINFAPLWRLVPQNRSWQKECKTCWDSLTKGDYDWAHLAMHLWPERVVPKCAKDRSLAIAHDLDEIFWEEDEKGKSQPKTVSKETLEALIADRTSPTIKAALEDLLKASDTGNHTGKQRKRKS